MSDKLLGNLVPLPHVARALRDGGFTDQPVPYNRLYAAVLSNKIDAELMTSNRWGIRPSTFPHVVKVLGLAASEPKPARAQRAHSNAVAA